MDGSTMETVSRTRVEAKWSGLPVQSIHIERTTMCYRVSAESELVGIIAFSGRPLYTTNKTEPPNVGDKRQVLGRFCLAEHCQ